jgi:hypothetical protein
LVPSVKDEKALNLTVVVVQPSSIWYVALLLATYTNTLSLDFIAFTTVANAFRKRRGPFEVVLDTFPGRRIVANVVLDTFRELRNGFAGVAEALRLDLIAFAGVAGALSNERDGFAGPANLTPSGVL